MKKNCHSLHFEHLFTFSRDKWSKYFQELQELWLLTEQEEASRTKYFQEVGNSTRNMGLPAIKRTSLLLIIIINLTHFFQVIINVKAWFCHCIIMTNTLQSFQTLLQCSHLLTMICTEVHSSYSYSYIHIPVSIKSIHLSLYITIM